MALILGPDEAQLTRIQLKVGDREAHRQVMLVTESGLYKLIMRSDKPQARWEARTDSQRCA
jgi:prophage antirepressor-like protein